MFRRPWLTGFALYRVDRGVYRRAKAKHHFFQGSCRQLRSQGQIVLLPSKWRLTMGVTHLNVFFVTDHLRIMREVLEKAGFEVPPDDCGLLRMWLNHHIAYDRADLEKGRMRPL